MAAPACPSPCTNAFAGLGTGGRPAAGRAMPSNRPLSLLAPGDLAPVARLVDFHCVLIMKPSATREAVSRALWDAGMLVTVFRSLSEAEGLLVGTPVHAVLLDASLGAGLGAQLKWWLNAVGRGAISVVMFGWLTAEQEARALQDGVSHCLPFPGPPDAFARRLGSTMGFEPTRWRAS